MQRSPALRELQALFWDAVNGRPAPGLEALVVSTDSLGSTERLGIYSGMYSGRLHDVLAEDFEHVAVALGGDRFAAAVRAYLAAHPSDQPSVRHLGRHFPDFLSADPPSGAPPWLADMARLEWARVEMFDAPDATPIDQDCLRGVPEDGWPDLVLEPIPALTVLESAWPLHVLWEGEQAPAPAPTSLRIWRQDGVVFHTAMDRLESEALARLQSGQRLGEICEAFSHLEPDAAAAEAGALLARWVEDGVIAELC